MSMVPDQQQKSFSEEVAARLKEERESMGLTQAEFAVLGNLDGRAQQIFFENHDRYPDTRYFESLAERGVDVHWILTGQRQ